MTYKSDFFEEQADYDRQSQFWLTGFFFSTFLHIIASNFVLMLILWESESGLLSSLHTHRNYYIILTAALALVSVVATYLNVHAVSNVMKYIPDQAVKLDHRLPNFQEIINVSQEMAIAAGINQPAIYILDSHSFSDLNEFAKSDKIMADYANGVGLGSRSNSVIVLTREVVGLPRDEVQALLGHCMGGIVYGNSLIDAMLSGGMSGPWILLFLGLICVLFIGPPLAPIAILVSAPFLLIGGLGILVGRYFKCKVTRKRIFLCDAAAVQFTRNPQSLLSLLNRVPDTIFDFQFEEETICQFFFNHITTGNLDSRMPYQPPRSLRIEKLEKYLIDLT